MNSQMNKNNQLSAFTDRERIQSYPLNDYSHLSSQYQSPYITKGVFTHSINYDPSITLKTLDLVKVSGNPVILGRGALSTVYLAKDSSNNKNYAIKEMKKATLMDTLGSFEPVFNEIDIHSRLSHKNIIKVYNIHEDNDSIKIILEHAKHGSLYSYIKRRKGLSEKKAFDFFIQAAAAIHFLHSNNIIHRDLKPENFIIGDNDELKLCDFGWANRIYNNTRDTVCGTVEYMAPEIIKREQYDKAIDIWSLGVLLFELIHQHSPFNINQDNTNCNSNPYEIMTNIKEHSFIIEKDVSKECNDIITQMLEKDQKKRITLDDIFRHPFVKYHEGCSSDRNDRFITVGSNVPEIRRQMTTNDHYSNCKPTSGKVSREQSNKMKQIAAMLLSDTIDIDESRSTKSKSKSKDKTKNKGKNSNYSNSNTKAQIKPKNRLSFKMEMKRYKASSKDKSTINQSNNDSNTIHSKETVITPVKTMSVKLTNKWFSQLKKPIGTTPSIFGKNNFITKQLN